MAIYGYLLEFTGLMLLKFYLLKHPANVKSTSFKKINITTVFYTLYITVILRLLY